MLRRISFFAPPFVRHYSVGSTKHIDLQKELSQQIELFRHINDKLAALPEMKRVLMEIRAASVAEIKKSNKKNRAELLDQVAKVEYFLSRVEPENVILSAQKIKLMDQMMKTLADIKEECHEPVIHAIEPPTKC